MHKHFISNRRIPNLFHSRGVAITATNAGWWHENNAGSFGIRMNFLTFILSIVTLVEVLHMENIRPVPPASACPVLSDLIGPARVAVYVSWPVGPSQI